MQTENNNNNNNNYYYYYYYYYYYLLQLGCHPVAVVVTRWHLRYKIIINQVTDKFRKV